MYVAIEMEDERGDQGILDAASPVTHLLKHVELVHQLKVSLALHSCWLRAIAETCTNAHAAEESNSGH